MTRVFVIALAMLIAAGCSSTQPKEPESAKAATAGGKEVDEAALRAALTAKDEGDLVCRYERTVGSRIGTRVCRTQAQEQAAQEAGREAIDRYAHELDEDRKVSGN